MPPCFESRSPFLGLGNDSTAGTRCASLVTMRSTCRWNTYAPAFLALGWVAVCLFSAPAAMAQVAGAPKQKTIPGVVEAQSCAECHQAITNRSVRHTQAAADCAACHVQIGEKVAHKFAFPVAKEELCLKCHQLPAEQHSHVPVSEGKCMECHDPHGSEHKAHLVADPNKGLCLKCHSDMQKKAFVHGPVAVGACSTCHKPHSSALPKLLIADANALCITCHADTGKAQDGMHVHKALEQGCVKCHDSHSSDHKFQLRESSPNLCLQCHQEKFTKLTEGSAIVHGAINMEGGCTTCHEPHASKLTALQRTNQIDSCLKCHDKQLKMADGKMLSNMATLLGANTEKHGPIRDGHCTVCHDPHAAQKFRLLSDDYPDTFYAKFSLEQYQLCFKCHSPDLVTKQKGQGITQFRNGTQNLHALHVNQEKGRTCRACHEVHASKRPSHIRESVPFGNSNWLLEINYEKTEMGGSCSPGCHAPKKYERSGASTSGLIATPPSAPTQPSPAPAATPPGAETKK